MSKVCRTCKFYSDTYTRRLGGQTCALCLSPESIYRGGYIGPWLKCCQHEDGRPIDAYEKEEQNARTPH